jgi:hypothetical protein
MALPQPASIFMFDDLVEKAFLKACPTRAYVEMLRIAAERVATSA